MLVFVLYLVRLRSGEHCNKEMRVKIKCELCLWTAQVKNRKEQMKKWGIDDPYLELGSTTTSGIPGARTWLIAGASWSRMKTSSWHISVTKWRCSCMYTHSKSYAASNISIFYTYYNTVSTYLSLVYAIETVGWCSWKHTVIITYFIEVQKPQHIPVTMEVIKLSPPGGDGVQMSVADVLLFS